jgi:hypothetical protein
VPAVIASKAGAPDIERPRLGVVSAFGVAMILAWGATPHAEGDEREHVQRAVLERRQLLSTLILPALTGIKSASIPFR